MLQNYIFRTTNALTEGDEPNFFSNVSASQFSVVIAKHSKIFILKRHEFRQQRYRLGLYMEPFKEDDL